MVWSEEKIVSVLTELNPELICTVEILRNPTATFVQNFYKFLIDIYYCNANAWKISKTQARGITDGDGLADSVELLNVFKLAKNIFSAIAPQSPNSPAFRIVDLVQPCRKRTASFMFTGINFILFKHALTDLVFDPCAQKLNEKQLEVTKFENEEAEIQDKIEESKLLVEKSKEEIKSMKPPEETILVKKDLEAKLEEKKSINDQLVEAKRKILEEIDDLQQQIQLVVKETEEFKSMIVDNIPKIESNMEMLKELNTKLKNKIITEQKNLNLMKADNKQYEDLESQFTEMKIIADLQNICQANGIIEQSCKNLQKKINEIKVYLSQHQSVIEEKKKKLLDEQNEIDRDLEETGKLKEETSKKLIEAKKNLHKLRDTFQKKLNFFPEFIEKNRAKYLEILSKMDKSVEVIASESLLLQLEDLLKSFHFVK